MGGYMISIGDYVTRKSYNNDIIFKVVDIQGDNCFLHGVCVRLFADSPLNDLKIYNDDVEDDDFALDFNQYKTLDRNEYFYLPGKVLHIDGDNEFLEKSMNFYKKNKIMAYGIFSREDELSDNILNYLNKYNPDILVITGHDAMYRKKRNDGEVYKNTDNFVKAIREARKYEKSHEKLLIVAGACQSNYEELIKAGANFASSPKRVNIHALDPAIIASSLSFSNKNIDIDLIKILEKTKYGIDGMGGIITKGTMYVGYPR
jgi:spore coat assembly protein